MAYDHNIPDYYEIRQVSGNTWYINSPLLIPFYLTDFGHCILMDTGTVQMRSAIIKTLERNGITPVGIFCTHTHYDHAGNAGFFSEKYLCPIAMPAGEAEVCRTLHAIKSYLFCYSVGQVAADPQLAAIPCSADYIIQPEEDEILFCEIPFKIIHTPGHSIDHISIMTPDRICYAGDALMCGKSLTSSKFPYVFDMAESLNSLDKMKTLSCEQMILAHRGVVHGPYETLIEENRSVMKRQIAEVSALIDHQMTVEEIVVSVQKKMEIHIETAEQALALERFLRPYLEYLIDTGTFRQSVRAGLLCYEPL